MGNAVLMPHAKFSMLSKPRVLLGFLCINEFTEEYVKFFRFFVKVDLKLHYGDAIKSNFLRGSGIAIAATTIVSCSLCVAFVFEEIELFSHF